MRLADRRTDAIEAGIAAAAISAKVRNSQEIDPTTPFASSVGSAKPARFAIIPANAEAKDCAIIWFV